MAASRCVASILDACLTTPQDDASIPIDLSVGELVHPSALAHLGFKRTMRGDRGIGTHRFDGENRVLESADAVERLERSIPEPRRPGHHGRLCFAPRVPHESALAELGQRDAKFRPSTKTHRDCLIRTG
jgi:hypothetical protein